MRAAIHPDYHPIKIIMTNGTEYTTYSTYGKPNETMRLEIDPHSHPVWTGGDRKVIEKGQLSKFEKRFGNFGAGAKKETAKEETK